MHTVIGSPVGELTLVGTDDALTGVYFNGHRRRPGQETFGPWVQGGFEETTRQLGEYFAGELTAFDLPLAPEGDEFHRRVWDLLARIPYGETRSYGDLARELGDPSLAQAVGAANGRNPLCVVVPCHRVVGADGIGSYGSLGVEYKRRLLELEGVAV